MKIYLAYRSAYLPNSRHLKEFEEDSILSWFQKYWEIFTKEDSKDYVDVLGVDIYGFPIWQIDDEPVPDKPENFRTLISLVEKYFYNNEVEGDEDCLRVLTDDDEIELAWFLFTEKYKQENWEKVSIWFHPDIPSGFGETGHELEIDKLILTKGKNTGSMYFVSCPVYDSENLETLEGAYKIEGVRLPDLVEYLMNSELSCSDSDNVMYGLDELKFIQYLSRNSENPTLEKLIDICSRVSLTTLDGRDYNGFTVNQLLELAQKERLGESKILSTAHFCEVCFSSTFHYDYWVIFDDLWVEENLDLAKSILQFGESWKI